MKRFEVGQLYDSANSLLHNITSPRIWQCYFDSAYFALFYFLLLRFLVLDTSNSYEDADSRYDSEMMPLVLMQVADQR